MKKLLGLCLTLILMLSCLISCDLFEKCERVTCKEYENYAVFTFDDFPQRETISFKLSRSGLDEGQIYYIVNLSEGNLSIKYRESGLINIRSEQPLGEFNADNMMPINGSGGYVEGDEITIIFESFGNVSGEVILSFIPSIPHTHSYGYILNERMHQFYFTCGCKTDLKPMDHVDFNLDTRCDECGYTLINDNSEVAQAIIDYENQLMDEMRKKGEENPTYRFECPSVRTVFCTYFLQDGVSPDEFIENCVTPKISDGATVKFYKYTNSVMITFERNSFAENAYQNIQSIANDPKVKEFYVDMERAFGEIYIPIIEYYAKNANALKYETVENIINFDKKKSFIIRSKAEYDEYLNKIAEKYDYLKDDIEHQKALYDESFFEEKALVLTKQIVRGSGMIELTVDNLYVDSDKLYVVVQTYEPMMGTDDMQYRSFGFIVDKNDVINVTEVITLE